MADHKHHACEIGILSSYVFRTMVQATDERISAANIPLTGFQYNLLRHINHESLTITDLSRRLSLDPSTLVPVVDALEEKGYVRRERDPNDRRRLPLSATENGKKILQAMSDVEHTSPLYIALEKMGDEQVQNFIQQLRVLVSHLPDGDEILHKVDERLAIYQDSAGN